MKIIRTGKSEEIRTPWLSLEEAAIYCRMSVSTFNRKRESTKLPSGNFGTGHPKFYTPALDQWMKRNGNNGTGENDSE